MKTVLTGPLRYVPQGQVYPVDLPSGTAVEGRAAELAHELGIAAQAQTDDAAGAAGDDGADAAAPPRRRGKAAAAAPENK